MIILKSFVLMLHRVIKHIVGFDALAGIEPVVQDLVEDFDIIEQSRRVRALYPHEVPAQNAHPNLILEGRLARILVAGK
jgi:hypothetical protein